MDFDYKKYSLENLENWIHDAMSCAEATPQEIYDVIIGVVKENYYTYKHQTSQAYELLALLNSGIDNNKYQDHLNKVLSCDKDDPSPECKGAWNDFWQQGSTVSSVQYTDEELNAMCDAAEKQEEEHPLTRNEAVANGWEMTDDGFWIPPQKEDKVKKWVLPVHQASAIDNDGEYFVNFPDDLLEAADLKEGDQIEWVDNGDGSYVLRKVTKPSDA